MSATFDGGNHGNRWYESHASKLAANYFDKKFGTGSKTYQDLIIAGENPYDSPDIFDINVFVNGGEAAYKHPRHGYKYYEGHPTKSKWNGWQDIFFF